MAYLAGTVKGVQDLEQVKRVLQEPLEDGKILREYQGSIFERPGSAAPS